MKLSPGQVTKWDSELLVVTFYFSTLILSYSERSEAG
jgi:hypothetical protein